MSHNTRKRTLEQTMETFVESMQRTNTLLETIVIQNKKLCALMSNVAESTDSIDESAIEIQTSVEKLLLLVPDQGQRQVLNDFGRPIAQEDSNSFVPHAPYPKEGLNQL